MPTPEAASKRAEVDAQLRRLRIQALFLFALIVTAVLVLSVIFQRQAQQIRVDQFISCLTRQTDLTLYNARLPAGVPPVPLPVCPPDPR